MKPCPETFPYPLVSLPETDSTNRYLTQWCDEHPDEVAELTTVCAEYQTAGKGQRGNSWESAPAKNLLFSTVFYPRFLPADRQFRLLQCTALAICDVLNRAADREVSVKWPNDIYWRDRKLCGILIENSLQNGCVARSILGAGINVNQERFVSNAPNPVSLWQITGRTYDRHQLLADLIARIRQEYDLLKQPESHEDLQQRYNRVLYRREGMHRYRDAGGEFMAQLVCVEPDGRLVLQDEAGCLRSYLFKEVQYVL